MTPNVEWLAPATGAIALLSALLLAAGSDPARPALRRAGAAVLALASLALLSVLAVPALLPARSAIVHPDGTTDDPRVVATLLTAVGALAALAPALRRLRLPVLGLVGVVLPGVAIAGLVAALAYFAGLHQSLGLASLLVAGVALGGAIVLALRLAARRDALPLLLQAFGVAVLCVAGTLSLHGARSGAVGVAEMAPVDTLGLRVSLSGVESPRGSDRHVIVLRVQGGPRDSVELRPALAGASRKDLRSVPAGGPFTGPVVVPIGIQERRPHAHSIQWLAKSDSLVAGDATIRFAGFRIEHTDSIRMYADLDVRTAAGTERVSPGAIATSKGEMPFAAVARGLGPIVVARFDADNHRVGLVLPQLAEGGVTHVAAIDIRLRPALPLAWVALLLLLAGFAWGLATPESAAPAKRA